MLDLAEMFIMKNSMGLVYLYILDDKGYLTYMLTFIWGEENVLVIAAGVDTSISTCGSQWQLLQDYPTEK